MFGKPKHKPAKAMAQPRDVKEAIKVHQGMAKKYPDMMRGEGAWGGPKKKSKTMPVSRAVKQAHVGPMATLHGALTEDEIKKLKGK